MFWLMQLCCLHLLFNAISHKCKPCCYYLNYMHTLMQCWCTIISLCNYWCYYSRSSIAIAIFHHFLIKKCRWLENSIKDSTLELLDLNRFYLLIDAHNLHRTKCLDFVACKRENLTHEHFTSSPMHVMSLGIFSDQ